MAFLLIPLGVVAVGGIGKLIHMTLQDDYRLIKQKLKQQFSKYELFLPDIDLDKECFHITLSRLQCKQGCNMIKKQIIQHIEKNKDNEQLIDKMWIRLTDEDKNVSKSNATSQFLDKIKSECSYGSDLQLYISSLDKKSVYMLHKYKCKKGKELYELQKLTSRSVINAAKLHPLSQQKIHHIVYLEYEGQPNKNHYMVALHANKSLEQTKALNSKYFQKEITSAEPVFTFQIKMTASDNTFEIIKQEFQHHCESSGDKKFTCKIQQDPQTSNKNCRLIRQTKLCTLTKEQKASTQTSSKDDKLIRQKLQSQLKKIGLVPKQIVSDGNCLYRTLSYLQSGNENGWESVKQSIIQYIQRNKHNHELVQKIWLKVLSQHCQIQQEGSVDKYLQILKRRFSFGSDLQLYVRSLDRKQAYKVHAYKCKKVNGQYELQISSQTKSNYQSIIDIHAFQPVDSQKIHHIIFLEYQDEPGKNHYMAATQSNKISRQKVL